MRTASEVWAIINEDNKVMFTGGGSSTAPKLMVYDTEAKAKRGLKYVPHNRGETPNYRVEKIYDHWPKVVETGNPYSNLVPVSCVVEVKV